MAPAVATGILATMKFPIFILSKDDGHIHIVKDSNELNWMEKIDVENELYSGWDSDGYPFKVTWDEKVGIRILQTSNQPQCDEMRGAILQYVERYSAYYRPDRPFVYDKESSDYIGIINAMRNHIRRAPLRWKVVNFFRRF